MRYRLPVLMFIVACGNPAGSETAAVRVTMVERLTVAPQRTIITVTNQGRLPIYLGACSVWIQAYGGGEWRTVFSPSCSGAVTVVAPGESHIREYAYLPSEAFPVHETYRAAVAYQLSESGAEIMVYGPAHDR